MKRPPVVLPSSARWLVLSNPVFSPLLARLGDELRRRGGGIAAAFETPDFDLGLWSESPLRAHPALPQEYLATRVRHFARSIALCDAFLVTGPAMAARLKARNPAALSLTLPFALDPAHAPIEVPWRPVPPRRILFEVTAPPDRAALRRHEPLLAQAAEVLKVPMEISEAAFLTPAFRDHPRLTLSRIAPSLGPGDIVFYPPSGDGAWQIMQSGAPLSRALAAGATCWGAIPEQVRVSPAPPHRLMQPDHFKTWTPNCTAASEGGPTAALTHEHERAWLQACRPGAAEARLVNALAPLLAEGSGP
ncbi:hypothetical protein OCH239_10205 [Roseivivax halodurans JCM 10272]|uniref:Uncharacterized protein n=1 Tax=Roseivivax halodurans JCM 10272 TaxID=1449350 RepID=X7EBN1_9RHOB|nr:hypothetical protein [Roseivivax halodurans]ETX13479.1 hypothetical protein OCH239_10205 [Roseivivax halodurans JCM 10272]